MKNSFRALNKEALPLDRIVSMLKTALSKTWGIQRREFMIDVLRDAETLGTKEAPIPGEKELLLRKAEAHLGEGLAEAARRPVLSANMDAYAVGLRAVSADFSFTLPDLDALEALRGQTLFWVRNAYNRALQEEMTAALDDYFTRGGTRIELAARLETFLTGKEPAMRGYFDLLADHNATRIAEIGHVSGYEQAGTEYVEIHAVLDEKTSRICRHLHGRLIPVSALSSQRNSLLDAARRGDFEAAKSIQPLFSGASEAGLLAESRTSRLVGQGVGMPPYHFRCRTTTVAHYEPAEYWRRAAHWGIDGEMPAKETSRMLDYARNARWGTHSAVWGKTFGGDGKEHPTSFVHYKKHGRDIGASSMTEYNERIDSLIRRGGRDAYMVIRRKEYPYPQLLFYDEKSRELAVINIKGQQIASFFEAEGFKFEKLLKRNDVVLKLEKMRGVVKWTRFMPI